MPKNKHNKMSHLTPKMLNKMFNPSTDNNILVKERLIQVATVSTNAAGFIPAVISMNPSSASEWTQMAILYDEFRVLGLRVSVIPLQAGTVSSLNGIVSLSYDNDDSVPLTTIQAGLEYDTAQVLQALWYESRATATQFTWTRPTSGTATAIPWIDIANPSLSLGSVKFASSTLSVTIGYFDIVTEWFVEFRGRR